MLYRASRDGDKAKDFHRKCDNIRRTLTIIRTDKGYVFGGYNPAKWNQVKSGLFKAIGAWIFGFDESQKKIIQSKYDGTGNGSIGSYSGYGPYFGQSGWTSMHISNDCRSTSASFIELENGNGYPRGDKGKHFLSGGDRYFKVFDYEVYTPK